MKKSVVIFMFLLVTGCWLLGTISHAFFVGFGSAGGTEQVIKKGQDEGKIPLVPPTTGGNLAPSEKTLSFDWALIFKPDGECYGWSVATDQQNKIYVTGGNNFGTTVKLNSAGDTLGSWSREIAMDFAKDIDVDIGNNFYIAGYKYNGSNNDFSIIKSSSAGDSIFTLLHNNGQWEDAYSIVLDDTGNIYITGTQYPNVGVDGDFMTVKYNPGGDTLLDLIYDSGFGNDIGQGIDADDTGKFYVVGSSFIDTKAVGLVVKYKTSGETEWVRWYYDGTGVSHSGVAIDSSGNFVYVLGTARKTPVSTTGYLLIKYKSNGDTVWEKIIEPDAPTHSLTAADIAIDNHSNIFVIGTLWDGFDQDCFTVEFNTSGDTIWQHQYGAGDNEEPHGVTLDSSDNVYVAGDFNNDKYLLIKYTEK